MTQKVDLVLVNPGAMTHLYGKLGPCLSAIQPPYWTALLAAFIRAKGYSVRILDAEAENWSPEYTAEKIIEYNPCLAGIIVLGSNPPACSTPKMTAVREVLTALRKKNSDIKTILSGIHPSALPERTLREEDVDFVCQGEGFYTFLQLLKALKSGKNGADSFKIPGLCFLYNGELIINPQGSLVNPDELPLAAWNLLPMDKYRAHNWFCFDHINRRSPFAAIYTSYGCFFKCSYCPDHALFGGKTGIRFRSPEKVIEEIDLLVTRFKVKNLKIADDLFIARKDRVERICDLIIQRGYDLNIWVFVRPEPYPEDLLKKIKQAGVNWVAIGIESANQQAREGVNKKIGQDKIRESIDMFRNAGINIIANFMFGLPDDNIETMQQTLDMAMECNFEYINFYVTMAYPGSNLYQESLRAGVKLPDRWHAYAQFGYETLPLSTKYISGEDVLRFRDDAFEKYFSNPKYLEMIKDKFGSKTVEHIEEMLKYKIKRKILHNKQESIL